MSVVGGLEYLERKSPPVDDKVQMQEGNVALLRNLHGYKSLEKEAFVMKVLTRMENESKYTIWFE